MRSHFFERYSFREGEPVRPNIYVRSTLHKFRLQPYTPSRKRPQQILLMVDKVPSTVGSRDQLHHVDEIGEKRVNFWRGSRFVGLYLYQSRKKSRQVTVASFPQDLTMF